MVMACALNYSSEKKTSFLRIPASWGRYAWSIGRDDPRRAVHALKAGTALTLVSLLYILEPFFNGIGKNAMWAVMTVVVVLEFTAGNWSHQYKSKRSLLICFGVCLFFFVCSF
jgi:hypothetical protein